MGENKVWSYYHDDQTKAVEASNAAIRRGQGHSVSSYFRLATKVAELQYLNRDHVLLFRGQNEDVRSSQNLSSIKAKIFRALPRGDKAWRVALRKRYQHLSECEELLVQGYEDAGLMGIDRLRRQRILRWSILQHYEVCPTPLLDVTQSLRVAASFASMNNEDSNAYLMVFAVPNVSGAITASSEAGLQIVRLSSACPPAAARPHLQEGYLLGEYPDLVDYTQSIEYDPYEMDFGRRLVAKFSFDPSPRAFWRSSNFPPLPREALYLPPVRDPLLEVTKQVLSVIGPSE